MQAERRARIFSGERHDGGARGMCRRSCSKSRGSVASGRGAIQKGWHAFFGDRGVGWTCEFFPRNAASADRSREVDEKRGDRRVRIVKILKSQINLK